MTIPHSNEPEDRFVKIRLQRFAEKLRLILRAIERLDDVTVVGAPVRELAEVMSELLSAMVFLTVGPEKTNPGLEFHESETFASDPEDSRDVSLGGERNVYYDRKIGTWSTSPVGRPGSRTHYAPSLDLHTQRDGLVTVSGEGTYYRYLDDSLGNPLQVTVHLEDFFKLTRHSRYELKKYFRVLEQFFVSLSSGRVSWHLIRHLKKRKRRKSRKTNKVVDKSTNLNSRDQLVKGVKPLALK